MEQGTSLESKVASNIASQLSGIPIELVRTVAAIVVIYLCMLLAFRIINRKIEDVNRRHKARRAALYVATAVVLVVVALGWAQQMDALPLILSITAAGLVVALGDAILSVAGWLFILVRRPYSVGDRVKIGGVTGDVIDIRLFQTTLLEVGEWVSAEQSTFRLAHCPNNILFREPVWDYTSGFPFIWDELDLTVTFESDWESAREIMLERAAKGADEIRQRAESALKQFTRKYPIKYPTLSPAVYVRIVDNGVKLALRYLVEARRRRMVGDELSRGILEEFGTRDDINFAYPTTRIVREPGTTESYGG